MRVGKRGKERENLTHGGGCRKSAFIWKANSLSSSFSLFSNEFYFIKLDGPWKSDRAPTDPSTSINSLLLLVSEREKRRKKRGREEKNETESETARKERKRWAWLDMQTFYSSFYSFTPSVSPLFSLWKGFLWYSTHATLMLIQYNAVLLPFLMTCKRCKDGTKLERMQGESCAAVDAQSQEKGMDRWEGCGRGGDDSSSLSLSLSVSMREERKGSFLPSGLGNRPEFRAVIEETWRDELTPNVPHIQNRMSIPTNLSLWFLSDSLSLFDSCLILSPILVSFFLSLDTPHSVKPLHAREGKHIPGQDITLVLPLFIILYPLFLSPFHILLSILSFSLPFTSCSLSSLSHDLFSSYLFLRIFELFLLSPLITTNVRIQKMILKLRRWIEVGNKK